MIPSGPSNTLKQRWPLPLSAYVIAHGVWFLLYAFLGKGFAYAGFPPMYVGELLLLAGIGVLVGSRRVFALAKTPLGVLMMLFLAFQVACSLPYVDTYGLDTLRDSVIWAYAGFAWVTAALVLRLPGLLRGVMVQFGRFSRAFLILGPIAWVATLYFSDALPHWPGTNVSIPSVKGGEFCVHLAGIFAFILLELSPISRLWLLLTGADALLGMRARGGLLAFLVASLVALGIRPKLDRFVVLLAAGLMLVVAMADFDVRIVIPDTTREFSLDQLSNSVASIFTTGDYGDLENTKAWRLAWWNKIWDYTVNGPYFWTGKGYGINLADSDGFQVGTREEPLRSPHSSHLTFLARSGIPGFLLWIGLQLSWALSLVRSYREASRRNATEFARLFAWLLTYWLAFMVSAGFDVFLEGPMAGIPFWTIFGLGWGGHVLFQSCLKQTGVAPVAHSSFRGLVAAA
jgi:hypothetical protein